MAPPATEALEKPGLSERQILGLVDLPEMGDALAAEVNGQALAAIGGAHALNRFEWVGKGEPLDHQTGSFYLI
jgi:hypothetical protein